MFPVGLIGRYGVSSPIIKNGTLAGYYDGWIGGRKFPVDMAGKCARGRESGTRNELCRIIKKPNLTLFILFSQIPLKLFIVGFAVNVNFFLGRPKASMPYKAGYEEDGFLQSLAPFNISEIEFLAKECTEVRCETFRMKYFSNLNLPSFLYVTIKILVWHTQTKKNNDPTPLNLAKYNGTNLEKLTQSLVA